MLNDTDDQVIIITGGSRGIGQQLVAHALSKKTQVVSCSRNSIRVDEENYLHVNLDLANPTSVDELFRVALNKFGKITAVINNAAISYDSLLISCNTEHWEKVIGVNLTAPFYISQCAVKYFIKNNIAGCLVHVGSIAQNGSPSNACYATSKGGLAGLNKFLADEFGKFGIYSYLVTLGFIETELTKNYPDFAKRVLVESCPEKRSGSIEEAAESIYYLASHHPKILNGKKFHVSGGLIDFPLDFPR